MKLKIPHIKRTNRGLQAFTASFKNSIYTYYMYFIYIYTHTQIYILASATSRCNNACRSAMQDLLQSHTHLTTCLLTLPACFCLLYQQQNLFDLLKTEPSARKWWHLVEQQMHQPGEEGSTHIPRAPHCSISIAAAQGSWGAQPGSAPTWEGGNPWVWRCSSWHTWRDSHAVRLITELWWWQY